MGLARSDVIAPTDSITETGEERVLAGIRVVFQNTPDAEAPAEMNFFFPDHSSTGGLLCMAENCTHTLHNLYPIRGAQTRDALAWSKYVQEALLLWGDATEVMFASHHWPRFGNADVRRFLEMQRDVYRWIHDQTMRLANQGAVPAEISAALQLPEAFTESHVRGYYGTVSHNAKSVYTRYLGWYDGNPAHLDPLPPVEAASRYVDAMGGADAALDRAAAAFAAGDYRWVAELVNHVVFAEPDNVRARHLQADALEQLGYQAESATWRNAYLMGAKELREGTPDRRVGATRDMSAALSAEALFDLLGVRFDPARFGPGEATLDWVFTDLDDERHTLGVARSTVHHVPGGGSGGADATITTTRAAALAAADGPAGVRRARDRRRPSARRRLLRRHGHTAADRAHRAPDRPRRCRSVCPAGEIPGGDGRPPNLRLCASRRSTCCRRRRWSPAPTCTASRWTRSGWRRLPGSRRRGSPSTTSPTTASAPTRSSRS